MTIVILVTGSWAQCSADLPESAVAAVREATSVARKRWRPARFGKGHVVPDRFSLLKGPLLPKQQVGWRFPAGLVWPVSERLRAAGYAVEVRRSIPRFAVPPWAERLRGIEALRPHQREAVEAGIELGWARIEVGTSGGKTEIGAEWFRRRPIRTLWMTKSLDLLTQTVERLRERLGAEAVGVLGGGQRELDRPLVVATIQTLHALRKRKQVPRDWWTQWHRVIMDEAQYASSKSWYDLVMACTHTQERFALSGTMLTGNAERDLKLAALTGPLRHIIGVVELAEQSLAAMPDIRWASVPTASYPTYEQSRAAVCPDAHRLLLQARATADFDEAKRLRARARAILMKAGARIFAHSYAHGIMQNSARNDRIVDLAVQHVTAGEKVLVLCTKIAHGDRLKQAFARRNVRVAYLHGSDAKAVRAATLKAYRRFKGGMVLIASEIFNAGIDAPEIDALIMAGAGGKMSPATSLQKVGRAVRFRPDKPTVPVYDFLDGWKNADKDYLAEHTRARHAAYASAGYPQRRV